MVFSLFYLALCDKLALSFLVGIETKLDGSSIVCTVAPLNGDRWITELGLWFDVGGTKSERGILWRWVLYCGHDLGDTAVIGLRGVFVDGRSSATNASSIGPDICYASTLSRSARNPPIARPNHPFATRNHQIP